MGEFQPKQLASVARHFGSSHCAPYLLSLFCSLSLLCFLFCSVSCCALTPPKVSDQVRTALTPKSLRAPARRAGGFKIHCSTHGSRLSLSRLSSPYPVAALARARPTGNNRHRKPSLALGLRPTGSAARFLCKLLCFCVNCSKTVPETVVFLCKLL